MTEIRLPHDVEMIRLTATRELREQLADDLRTGFRSATKTLPSKYFYDARGSSLFEKITRLPEYYLTRAETEILERHAADIMRAVEPKEIVEIGSGSSRKTRLLLEAMHDSGCGERYVPFDVSESALAEAAHALVDSYPWLEITLVRGDFHTDLAGIPRGGRRLVIFLGSTIGNLRGDEIDALYRDLASMLRGGDAALIGYDLVKDTAVLEAAYNDSEGITAEFNRNILRVVNEQLGADFAVDEFEHVSVYDERESRIESGLRATRPMLVRVAALGEEYALAAGELIHTEISAKFERRRVQRDMEACGLRLERWLTDDDGMFALGLARPQHGDG